MRRWMRLAALVMLLACVCASAGERSIADLVEQTSSSVVYIEGDDGCGSGFVVATDPHVEIYTNHHVMMGSMKFTIGFFMKSGQGGGTERIDVPGRAYFAFPRLDFGVIRLIDDDPAVKRLRPRIKALPKGDSLGLRVGEQVFAIGSPGAGMVTLGNSVSDGIISGKNRHHSGIPYLQTTAPINFGNSGGPLMNLKGEAIGIVTSKSIYTENIGFALPIHMTDGKHYSFYLPEKLSKECSAHMAAGDRLIDQKRFEEADREFRKAEQFEPDKARPFMGHAYVYMAQGQLDKGAELYRKAMRQEAVRYDDLMMCVLELGKIHGRGGNSDKAIAAFRFGLERDPYHEALNRNIGVTYANMGHKSKALAHWYISLCANPDQPKLMDNVRKLIGR